MFVGEISELPIGQGGFTGTHNQSQVQPDQLIQADSLTFESGTLQKEGGAAKYNTSAIAGSPQIMGGHDWWPSAATQRMIVVGSDSKIYKDSGAGTFPVTLKTLGSQPSVPPVFVEGGKEVAANNRKLFIFTGSNQIQVLSADGATTADIATPSPDWAANYPTAGCVHAFRMWAWGNANDPHRLYYSTNTNHEDFTGGVSPTGSGTISVYSGEGERIITAISFKGQLIVFKYPSGIYAVDTTDPSPANWGVSRLSRAPGIAGYYCAVNVEDDILFFDIAGIFHMLSAVRDYGDYALQSVNDLAYMTPYIRDNINLARLQWTRHAYYTAKKELHFTLPQGTSLTNNHRLVLDINDPSRIRFRYSTRDQLESLWLRKDSNNVLRLTGGDQAGFVWKLDQSVKTKDGAAYSSIAQTPHYDLSHIDPQLATLIKTGVALELVVEPKGNWTLGVDIYWDGKYFMSTSFNMGVSGAALGSFVLDTDALGSDQILSKKRRIAGSGRRISLVITDSGAGTDFSVSKMFLHWLKAADRNSK